MSGVFGKPEDMSSQRTGSRTFEGGREETYSGKAVAEGSFKKDQGANRSACTRMTVLTGQRCVPQGETPLGTVHPASSLPAGENRTCFVTICSLKCPTNGN